VGLIPLMPDKVSTGLAEPPAVEEKPLTMTFGASHCLRVGLAALDGFEQDWSDSSSIASPIS
jgi:hypothetical protein